jgi:AcrR family transcriptional regulator
MSKSGVITHFGSKEELQLATIDAAQAIYVAEIVQPALGVPPGLGRVRALVDGFLSYSERHVFPGGCFFGTTIVEQAARPGPIRERLARAHVDWIGMLRLFLDQARDQGELGVDIDTNRIAFEMAALLTSADWSSTLHDEPSYLELARQAITELLDSITSAS